MLRLLQIEFFKLRYTRFFWILAGLFLVFLLAVPIAAKAFLDYLATKGETMPIGNFSIADLPLFDFVDLWQNMTWFYQFFTLFVGFIIVISIANEYSYGTIKQNIIDGMSRTEFWLSKLVFIFSLSVIYSLAVLIIGLIVGLLWSPVTDFNFIVENIQFLPAYFLHLFAFQLFCMTITLLIKRSGIAIAALTFYVYVVEPIITSIISFKYEFPEISALFPVNAMTNMIRSPYPKYALQEVQTYVSIYDTAIVLAYIGLFLWVSYWILGKRDLR